MQVFYGTWGRAQPRVGPLSNMHSTLSIMGNDAEFDWNDCSAPRGIYAGVMRLDGFFLFLFLYALELLVFP